MRNILDEGGGSGVVIEEGVDLVKEGENVQGEMQEVDGNDYGEEGVMVKGYVGMNRFLMERVDEMKEGMKNVVVQDIEVGGNRV